MQAEITNTINNLDSIEDAVINQKIIVANRIKSPVTKRRMMKELETIEQLLTDIALTIEIQSKKLKGIQN